MATKKKSITYSEPSDYFSKEAMDILNGKKKTTKKRPTKKSSTGKKKK